MFFMLVKVFYWMRLFESTAKYVRLITQTIEDCLAFMGLVLVVFLAFSSFYFVINMNYLADNDSSDGAVSYTIEYSGY